MKKKEYFIDIKYTSFLDIENKKILMKLFKTQENLDLKIITKPSKILILIKQTILN